MSATDQCAPARNCGAPWATAVIAVAAVAAWGWSDSLSWLALDRGRTLAGEVWRLWTGHLVHFSGSHLAWNLAVLVPAGAWAEWMAAGRTRLLLAAAPLVMSGVLLVADPALHVYAGLSGLAAGAITLLALLKLRGAAAGDRWFWRAILALVAAKVGLESFGRTPVFAAFGAPDIQPVPLVHVVGMVGALAVFFLPKRAA